MCIRFRSQIGKNIFHIFGPAQIEHRWKRRIQLHGKITIVILVGIHRTPAFIYIIPHMHAIYHRAFVIVILVDLVSTSCDSFMVDM